MLLKDLVLNSLESLDKTHIDYGSKSKALTPELYEELADCEVKSFYLDIDKYNLPCMIVQLVQFE